MGARAAQTADKPVLVDSDVLISYLRGSASARDFVNAIPHRFRLLSDIVAMEVLFGSRDAADLRRLRRFLDSAFERTVHVTAEVSRRARLLLERHVLAHRMWPADALIAATALTVGASLATANVHDFRFVKGLHIVAFRQ